MMKAFRSILVLFCLVMLTQRTHAAGPTVSKVRASQRAGTQLVDVYYDLADPDGSTLTVSVAVSTNGGASYTPGAASFTGALGAKVTPEANKRITWNAGMDWPNKFSANVPFRVSASDDTATSGMVLIPAGSFTMGDTFSEGGSVELPLHTDDMVKRCNARSEKEGKTPAYYTGVGLSVPYRIGSVDVQNDWVKWNAGYRLPTDGERRFAASLTRTMQLAGSK